MPFYELNCAKCDIDTISTTLNDLTRSVFELISCSADCLNHLLPTERRAEITDRLRCAIKLPGILRRTIRYLKPFLRHALDTFKHSSYFILWLFNPAFWLP